MTNVDTRSKGPRVTGAILSQLELAFRVLGKQLKIHIDEAA